MTYIGKKVRINIGYTLITGKVIEETKDQVLFEKEFGEREWYDKDRIRFNKGRRK